MKKLILLVCLMGLVISACDFQYGTAEEIIENKTDVYILLNDIPEDFTQILGIFSTYENANDLKELLQSDNTYFKIYKIKLDQSLVHGPLDEYEINNIL